MVRRIEEVDSAARTTEIYWHVVEANSAPDPDGLTDCSNPWLFTGRAVDILDNSSLKIQYNFKPILRLIHRKMDYLRPLGLY